MATVLGRANEEQIAIIRADVHRKEERSALAPSRILSHEEKKVRELAHHISVLMHRGFTGLVIADMYRGSLGKTVRTYEIDKIRLSALNEEEAGGVLRTVEAAMVVGEGEGVQTVQAGQIQEEV